MAPGLPPTASGLPVRAPARRHKKVRAPPLARSRPFSSDRTKNASTAWKAATHGDDFGACREALGFCPGDVTPVPGPNSTGHARLPIDLRHSHARASLAPLRPYRERLAGVVSRLTTGLPRLSCAAALTWGFAVRAKNQPTRRIAVDTHDHHSGRSARGYYRKRAGPVSSVSFLTVVFTKNILPPSYARLRRERSPRPDFGELSRVELGTKAVERTRREEVH